uniref:DUF4249 family protein n=1 Tax=Roseihalotalea indica TaxID=2867963 RepID=A0AA49JEJ6_9BACT|nr:hypothetical protein K4G66_18355 [Tunicatimonas sp. TK19036]
MKQGLYIFSFLFITMGVSACFDEPDYSDVPFITGIDDFYFVDVASGADSLIIRVSFQDGDGDLGLSNNEIDPELALQFTFPPGPNGEKYYIFDGTNPDLVPYDCRRYQYFETIGQDTIRDTVMVDYNPYYYNFEVIWYTKVDNEYKEFDFRSELCRSPLAGRFPYLKKDFSNTKPLEGTIKFSIPSIVFKPQFRNDSLKFGVIIRDRAKHESNVVESPPFTLEGITRAVD